MKESEKKEIAAKYAALGVSASKNEVHGAVKKVDKGLFENTFCRIFPDIAGDREYVSVFHADGAGTKSIIGYMMYRETGDPAYLKGLAVDAAVMNTDDILCVGLPTEMMLTDTIGRNKNLIGGDGIAAIIEGFASLISDFTGWGYSIRFCGGETADIGDLVRTIVVDAAIFARIPKDKLIRTEVRPREVILGLASFGKANYEEKYNSGIGSNGLTLARHGLLAPEYAEKFPECYDPSLKKENIYFGKYGLNDKVPGTPLTVGEALLSPTRTYAPVMYEVLGKYADKISAVFHNTGGGQTKCLGFGKGIRYIKNNLFPVPPLFEMIQESSDTSPEEMYAVFNMGHRLEILTDEDTAAAITKIAGKFGIDARIVGFTERADGNRNELIIESEYGKFDYTAK